MRTVRATPILRVSRGIAFFVLLAFPLSGYPQQTSDTAASQTDQLLQRISALEAKVKQLEEKPAAPGPAPTPAPEPDAAPPEVNEVAERLKLEFFGDTGFQTGHFYGPTNTFEFGEFNMFVTSRLSDHVSVLGDMLLIANADNSVGVDVERLFLKYRQNDNFSASIGRIHTAIGYYNTAFDRGDYVQTTIGRPVMYQFDDQGGFLPMQDLGIVLNGQIPSGKLRLSYVFEVTNGRDYGANVEPAQNSSDRNNGKAVNFGLSARPHQVQDLLVGFSFRHDKLSDVLNLGVSENIPVVYAIYTGHNYEWLNEGMWVRHELPGGAIYRTPGFYTQISRGFGPYRPYFRYSYVNAPNGDPIYGNPAEIEPVGRINGPSVGLRYDFTEHTAFKLQYDREASNNAPTSNGGSAQFDFIF
jgi:hypothetical protein